MKPMEASMEVFLIEPLKAMALEALALAPRSSSGLAIELAVPLHVADHVLDLLMAEGRALPATGGGWQLSAIERCKVDALRVVNA